jgi:hypothetical protein
MSAAMIFGAAIRTDHSDPRLSRYPSSPVRPHQERESEARRDIGEIGNRADTPRKAAEVHTDETTYYDSKAQEEEPGREEERY